MARLDNSKLASIRKAVDACEQPWILVAYEREEGVDLPASLEGPLGYFDWRLHGQISRLVRRGLLPKGGMAMLPGEQKTGKSSLLIYNSTDRQDGAPRITESLKKLQAKEVAIVEETWPEELCAKMKKALTKAGIPWSSLDRRDQ